MESSLFPPAERSVWRDRGLMFGVAAVYFFAARGGLLLAAVHPSVTAVWPPSGIALAVLVVFGGRFWPGVWLGAFAINFVVNRGHGAGPALAAAVAAGIAVGNTLEPWTGAALLKRSGPGGVTGFLRLAFLAAGLSPLLSALGGATSLCLGGLAPWKAFHTIALTWWLGDAMGVLVFAPFLLELPSLGWRVRPRRAAEAGALVLLLFLLSGAVFGAGPWTPGLPLEFLVIPFLLWAAFRFGPLGGSAAVVELSVVAILATARARGPFARFDWKESLALLQAFLGTLSLTTGVVAALAAEREGSRRVLQAAHDDLDRRVRLRTQALDKANADLRAEVRERERGERSLRRMADELQRSNAELELFASSASHDLKEPLRKVVAFGDILAQTSASVLGEEGRDSLRRMQSAAQRMSRLIDDLLQYSKAAMRPQPFRPVPLGPLLKEVLGDLEQSLRESEGSVEAAELPVVSGDPVQLRLLFQNLIGNALKFRRPGERARVRLGWRPLDSGVAELRVEDDGIGFDVKFLDRIFKPFQKLHSLSEYPGSGMGLAICQKVVSRHGGRITAQSEPGRGAVFIFTLPLKEPSLVA